MSIVASLSLLAGIVLGLRFNVRLLFLVCTLVVIGSTGAALFGSVGPANAALFGAVTIVALQVGYFVSMVIGAMNLADAPQATTAQAGDKPAREGLEAPRM